MNKIVWAIVALIAAVVICHLLSKRSTGRGCGGSVTGTPCGPCGSGTTTTGQCFPGAEFHIKSGLFDLRNCNDDIYIMTSDRSKVHFIVEQ